MSNKVFQQNLDDKKGPQPGGPYLIQMLFKEPVEMPDKEKMTAIMEKHIGSTECFCYDKKMAGFAAQEHIAEFKDGKCPVQLMVMKCDKFKGKGFDAFLMSQMWDCQEDRERIFRECKYQVVATDMLAAALPALERANLDADFLEALAELYPTCKAFYFQNCGKLFLAEDVRSHQIEGPDRFIRFGVNVRFFNIEGTEDMLIDTVGMSTLFLPDLQYHFHDMDPNWVVNHAYNAASYDDELQQVNIAKTRLMAQKAELEKEQRGAAAFESRLAELDMALEQASGTLTDFDELTVRQLISNIKVLDKDSLLICFKDGTEITQAMQRRQTA